MPPPEIVSFLVMQLDLRSSHSKRKQKRKRNFSLKFVIFFLYPFRFRSVWIDPNILCIEMSISLNECKVLTSKTMNSPTWNEIIIIERFRKHGDTHSSSRPNFLYLHAVFGPPFGLAPFHLGKSGFLPLIIISFHFISEFEGKMIHRAQH